MPPLVATPFAKVSERGQMIHEELTVKFYRPFSARLNDLEIPRVRIPAPGKSIFTYIYIERERSKCRGKCRGKLKDSDDVRQSIFIYRSKSRGKLKDTDDIMYMLPGAN